MQHHFNDLDEKHMRRALELAWQGRFSTSPNPRVGCVIAHGEQIVGQGFHLKAGEPHAEVHAIRQAGAWAKGATAYVTLEPCAHYGRTPPCAEGLIQAGVKRVVAAMRDPNPLVAGKGLNMLENVGIETAVGLLEHEARSLNRGFLSRIERNRPFVKMKTAASLDGKIALSNGKSQWITNDLSRHDVQILRAESCAILTGIGTVLADNPRLNVRALPTLRQPTRIVLDSSLKTPESSHIIQDQNPTFLVTLSDDVAKFAAYPHVKIIRAQADNGRIDLADLLKTLADNGIGELMIEAGSTVNSAVLAADLVDEIVHYQSPKILGAGAQSLFRLPENEWALQNEALWQTVSVQTLGDDVKWVLQKKHAFQAA
ncbi:bifunctional diaminohydroxyphosphoribosylaminopyrimidine deaminase/5-amino-6-(5-phosphoribosylamino)uracil reductase RibD [Alysiella filiformis]|uniref:Riboflavin biosynthesis protein RibD n=1 Tax=Alysiella filiformis DSM 16848 TaxID=1120981 RepID=A0A286E5X7_9NEIS|nr:bifunctional diaminohydroxyphosphoribosylaminopyrimidine deaminase/5-amino-6-(5-phosphoribosylamino)uracil reductase RibD [Alysiella filiformis]QMT32384.1 bifunctional diaminohydroxyphosphoribosylaminopyrimidine deaminase/5-amino-6-(5-phosphoribosylamino)uracil reductase RibD [Alysiella filiformis]UBQ56695.1 bifunctional diaminohydroxyphosphoribosylaminopyrimidine deaminase/5-amino-6-(5-phosphoribosylamino)uracil reductase RibD [Alysiella filiformis DSM 16848]SOD66279.1 diaminohydroxyphosphor